MLPKGSIFVLFDFKVYINVINVRTGNINLRVAFFTGRSDIERRHTTAKSSCVRADNLNCAVYFYLNWLIAERKNVSVFVNCRNSDCSHVV